MPANSNQLFSAFTKIQGGKFALNLFARVCNSPDFIYFGNPYTVPENFETDLVNFVAASPDTSPISLKRPKNFGRQEFCNAVEDPNFAKFSFFRDPVDRFCAAYHDKLSENAGPNDSKDKICSFLDLPLDSQFSLSDFAKIVAASDLDRDRLAFFRPQRKIIAYDLIDFDFIGDSENWSADLIHFLNTFLDIPISEKDLKIESPADVHDGIFDIDTETQRNIEKAYLQDLEMIEEIYE